MKNIPTGQGAPFEHPLTAAVTFEQHLLSDKLEDRMKESLSLSQWKATEAAFRAVFNVL